MLNKRRRVECFGLSANMGEAYPFACLVKTIGQCFRFVIPLFFDMQLQLCGDKIGIIVASNQAVKKIPFDFETAAASRLNNTIHYLDNTTLHRASLFPKYLSDLLTSNEVRIIFDSSPIFV
ncbi:MAG: hypothetical protein RLZZ628_2952 [Bacteroidota bacterium]|jgi:hypothetical protein